ncbi:hypothetical protein [Bowmanella dokdonensis]|uniref:Uncharacterized protein n=1 Tax=Bowmanella dokdonensis TaxID=751969 RepID=A0A939DRK8_9ALTE|nr:hypothetical protein [Bowmanella dokdonensis]MBN7827527.1 hypothetical protein [Bowmanella dokdonensis]
MQVNKLYLVLMMVFGFFAVYDWQSRVVFDDLDSDANVKQNMELDIAWAPLPETSAQKILSELAGYMQDKEPSPQQTKVEWTDEFQKQQQGELSSLFAGNQRYRLAGIVREKQHYALILAVSQDLQSARPIKLTVGEILSGYQLVELDSTNIKLVAGDGRTVNLKLFNIAGKNEYN